MNPANIQQQAQGAELTDATAFQYLGELIAEYMKTLPRPVRIPVVDAVNQATDKIAHSLNELQQTRKELEKLRLPPEIEPETE